MRSRLPNTKKQVVTLSPKFRNKSHKMAQNFNQNHPKRQEINPISSGYDVELHEELQNYLGTAE